MGGAGQPNFTPVTDGGGHAPSGTGALSPKLMGAFGHCVFRNYGNFSGRASRTEYWGFWLTFIFVVFVFAFAIAMAAAINDILTGGLAIIGGLAYIALIIPMLAVTIRRLHDSGRSGWWYLISFVPYVGGIILFVFTVLPSEQKVNQWGGPPRHE
tara:strand:+ start:1098 stop:1562 length:465 start_codon:yes stop_codon:yes gene_type:complete